MTPSELAKVAEFLGFPWRVMNFRLGGPRLCFQGLMAQDGVLLLALLEKLAERGYAPAICDRGTDYGAELRYEASWGVGLNDQRCGPTWLDAVVAAVMEVVK